MNTVDKMKPKLEKLKGKTGELKLYSETDHETVAHDVDELNDFYDKVKKNSEEKLGRLQKIKSVVLHLRENTEPVEELFDKIDNKLGEHPQFEADEKKIEKEVKKLEVGFARKYCIL